MTGDTDGHVLLENLMGRAVEHSIRHVRSGGIPFVGQLVSDDGYRSEFGVNRVRETGDPTAHAEIVAMRRTLRERAVTDLRGTRLLATGEPCAMCYRFATQHRVESIHFAVDAATAARWGFDYRSGYAQLGIDPRRAAHTVEFLPVGRALEPFHLYRNLHGTVAGQ
ncbi:deaminase [Nocardia sp. BMG111209]|uniref:deaminase n=1 Tax=Nocardia sp. BMG111209 TaxID=1160137 RepID=UPI000361CFEA|nr:deaminase [Nocardia sp. BMG111209]